MEKGILYGIGVGPGDPELMSLKALRLARECDVLALPHKEAEKCFAFRIALGAAPELKDKPIMEVDMPMTKDPVRLEKAYSEGAKKLCDALSEGKTVAFLTIGDPTVYSTYMYLHKRVLAAGFNAIIIPGITSFCAAAAALGESLCENAEQVHIIPGTYSPTEGLSYPGTKVLMKNNLKGTLDYLRENKLEAAMVEKASLPEQKIYRGTENIPEDAGYFSVVVVKENH